MVLVLRPACRKCLRTIVVPAPQENTAYDKRGLIEPLDRKRLCASCFINELKARQMVLFGA